MSPQNPADDLYQQIAEVNRLQFDEKHLSFILAYGLEHKLNLPGPLEGDYRSTCMFRVKQPTEFHTFVPDLDVLEVRHDDNLDIDLTIPFDVDPEPIVNADHFELAVYEVKGLRDDSISRHQLYTALGQASMLLSYPVLKEINIVLPSPDLPYDEIYPGLGADPPENFFRQFCTAIDQTPIGLFTIYFDSVKRRSSPELNPGYSEEATDSQSRLRRFWNGSGSSKDLETFAKELLDNW